MRNRWVAMAAVVVMVGWCAGGASAQTTLLYSFEEFLPTPVPPPSGGPDGFWGFGETAQELTIGVTHMENSMRYSVDAGGFVGVRTETLIPAALNDPPGISHILLDVTLTEPYAGTFADLGVTLFGHALNAPGGPVFGNQVQFADTVSLAGLSVGTHTDLRIDLDQSVGPYRPGESFNNIFGAGPNDLTVASAFQFFISKNAATPVTVYIDNVRAVVPEPSSLGLLALGGLGMLARRRSPRPESAA